ncbi:hypothetical protein FRC03_002154 [Tulasnella sp. 419]|nr:hypothetical protein FRC03_002154 [Tulasnella sp. 419]
MDEICSTYPGLVVSNQVPFSLIDTRPLDGMDDVCHRQGVKLLTYGTLCGGFLSDKWLDADEPDLYSTTLTPSQRKYLDIILNGWGNWDLFQELLTALKEIGDRHGGRSVANVATRWVLDHDFVACVIVGVRMGVSDHSEDNDKAYGFTLSKEDMNKIERVLDKSRGKDLYRILGDCGGEYRMK